MSENGMHEKPWDRWLENEWPQHRKETAIAMQKMEQMHTVVASMQEDIKHLKKLDTLSLISNTLVELKTGLIATLSGKNVIDVQTAKEMMAQQQGVYVSVIKTILWTLGVIVGVVTGVKFLAPQVFGV